MKYGIIFFTLSVFTNGQLISQTQPCIPATSSVYLDINNVKAMLQNGGDLWWDLYDDAQYEVPKVSTGSGTIPVHSLFAGALWIGGIDQGGQLRIAAQTYRQTGNDYWPGPLDQNAATDYPTCNKWDRHWKINKSDIDIQKANFQQYGNNIPLGAIPLAVKSWPGKGNPHALGNNNIPLNLSATEDYAPFIDVNADNIYNPEHGDHPEIRGDQAVWWIFNDNGNIHGETGGMPIGVEVWVMAYAYATSDPLNNTTFYHYEIKNKGNNSLDSVYIAHWVDVDLGYAFDDYIAHDSTRNMSVGLNGDAVDGPAAAAYGTSPPVIAVKLLKGPNEGGAERNMSNMLYYNNDFSLVGNPELPEDYYRYMTGTWKDGQPWTNSQGITNYSARYLLSQDSIYCTHTPQDSRFVMSSGPFTFNSGDVNTFDFGVVWSRCDSQYACLTQWPCLLTDVDYVQAFFNSQYPLNTYMPVIEDIIVEIYPNPTADNLRISWNKHISPPDIEIMDINGRRIKYIKSAENNITINLHELTAGIYFIKITAPDGAVVVKKLVKS